ncbi:MAG TPA: hypothetical protein LFV92_00275, partial [Rickettsia endosymbiont of Ceroptres masudai]|nr:hypothetical protein [Rickettsia endosymbiont of Ceroptres masudai]
IYSADMLGLYGLNKSPMLKALAFADDLVIYVTHRKLEKVREELEKMFRHINDYHNTWKLKINIDKCETVLFRPNVYQVHMKYAVVWRDFEIKRDDNSLPITHYKIVKYLGMHFDEKLRYNDHVKIQLKKSKAAYFSAIRLFHSKRLNARVKIICYTSLIRSILTYACQIWFNISSAVMEKLRAFERSCLRACLNMYKTPESNFTQNYSNSQIYNKGNIPRIDNFIIKMTRKHILNSTMVQSNSLISSMYYPSPQYFEKIRHKGKVPPEAFPYLDSLGLI